MSQSVFSINVDIDECSEAGSCGVNAVCNNNYGSYSCTCAKGYYGNGFTCTGKSPLQLVIYRNESIRTDSGKLKNKGFLYFFFFHLARFPYSVILFGGIYYITPHYYSQFEKLVAALIVTGKYGAETVAGNINLKHRHVIRA